MALSGATLVRAAGKPNRFHLICFLTLDTDCHSKFGKE